VEDHTNSAAVEAAKGVAVAKLGVSADAVQVLSAETQVVAGVWPRHTWLAGAGAEGGSVGLVSAGTERGASGLCSSRVHTCPAPSRSFSALTFHPHPPFPSLKAPTTS
jgi:hypothetical protein